MARDGIEPPTPAFSGPRSTTELPGLSADLELQFPAWDAGEAGVGWATPLAVRCNNFLTVYQLPNPGAKPPALRPAGQFEHNCPQELNRLRENSFPEGGGGFNPRMKPTELTWALAPEKCFQPTSSKVRPCSAASKATRTLRPAPHSNKPGSHPACAFPSRGGRGYSTAWSRPPNRRFAARSLKLIKYPSPGSPFLDR